MELDRSTNYHLDSKTPGPRFDINDTIKAIVLEFKSTFLFTLAYEKMNQFYCEVRACECGVRLMIFGIFSISSNEMTSALFKTPPPGVSKLFRSIKIEG